MFQHCGVTLGCQGVLKCWTPRELVIAPARIRIEDLTVTIKLVHQK